MKDLFPGHFKDDNGDIKDIWEECLFVFDANIILNLYRYSDPTRKSFFETLESIKSRVWLPHRVAEEYLSNRLVVIGQQEKSYEDTVSKIDALKKDLDNSRSHPFVSKRVMKKIDSVFSELKEELSKNKKDHEKRIRNDEIKKTVAAIFEGRVGDAYDKAKLEDIISDGEERYKEKIPPGYNDVKKGGDSDSLSDQCKKYGDLIVWKQILDKSSNIGRDIVLVTDDAKDDWWEVFKGKTIGPRPELFDEFKKCSGNNFHMFKADRFLEVASEVLGGAVSNEAVEEIREIRRRDIESNKKSEDLDNIIDSKYPSKKMARIKSVYYNELSNIENSIKNVEMARHKADELLVALSQKESQVLESDDELEHDDFVKRYNSVIAKKSMLDRKLHQLNSKKEYLLKRFNKIGDDLYKYEVAMNDINDIDGGAGF